MLAWLLLVSLLQNLHRVILLLTDEVTLKPAGRPPMIIKRSDGFIGVMIDDLITKGADEPCEQAHPFLCQRNRC